MIKVAHVTTVHKREDIRIFEKECSSLAKANYEVCLIVADGKGNQSSNGVSIYDIGRIEGRMRRWLLCSSKAYKKALELDCDIYHLHDPELLPCCMKLKRRNKRVIFDSHEDIYSNIKEKSYIPALLRPLVCFAVCLYQTYVLKRLDGIISVTPHICQRLKKYNNNTIMITNYPIIRSKEHIASIQNEEADADCALIFAGGITNQWQHDIVLDALTYCPNATYNLCGYAYFDYLQMLKGHSNWKKVNYFGSLPKSQVEILMNKSSIGLAILNYNLNVGGKTGSLGNTKLFEYMEAGLPFICTDFDLWQQIVSKYDCGICVNPTDAQSLAEAINYLIANPSKAKQMGQNGRKAVESEYNWSSQEAQLIAFYKDFFIVKQ